MPCALEQDFVKSLVYGNMTAKARGGGIGDIVGDDVLADSSPIMPDAAALSLESCAVSPHTSSWEPRYC